MAEFHYFIRLNNISLYVATTFYLFIHHSSIDRYLGYFYFGAIMNIAAMNIKMHVSFQISVFLSFCFRSELLGHMITLYFKEISKVFCIVAAPNYIPTASIGEFPFCTPFPTFIIIDFLMMVILTGER